MSNFKSFQSFYKIHTKLLDSNRKIIGLSINKDKSYNYYEVIPTEALIDTFKEIKKKCPIEWNNCTKDEICNKALYISQKYSAGSNVTKEEDTFINNNKTNQKMVKLQECFIKKQNEIKKIKIEEKQETIQNTNNQVIESDPLPEKKNNIIPLIQPYKVIFKNRDEFLLFASDFKYKLVKINETGEIISFKKLIDNGLTSINILDKNYNINTKFVFVGGTYDKKTFFNRKTYIKLFSNIDDFKSQKYPYFKENNFDIIGTSETYTLNELYNNKGMKDFTFPTSTIWDKNSVFKIIGGELDGKFINNKIDELIESSFLCNYINKIPYLGKYICGKRDYSLYFVILLIILYILFIYLLFRKSPEKSELTPEKQLEIKKAKVLQMEYNE